MDEFPTEILLKIFELVDIDTVHKSLYNVCVRFRNILSDQYLWKHRFQIKYGSDCHTVKYAPKDEIDWCNVLYESQKRENQWRNYKSKFKTFQLRRVHRVQVHSVHLMKTRSVVASGSYDGCLSIYNFELLSSVPSFSWNFNITHDGFYNVQAHKQCVWEIDSDDNVIYTSSWDRTINVWSVGNEYICKKNEYSFNENESMVPKIAAKHNLLAASLGITGIKVFDMRIGFNQYVHNYNLHKDTAFKVAFHGNYILSTGADGTFGVYDMRNCKTQKIPVGIAPISIPLKICANENVIYVTDTFNNLNIFHPTLFTLATILPVTKKRIYDIAYAPGMFAAAYGKHVVISHPTTPLKHYARLDSLVGNPISLDYKEDIIAIGGTECSVQLWIPKDRPTVRDY